MKRSKNVLLLSKEESYLVDSDKDFHTKDGVVKASELRRGFGRKVKSHLGKEFYIVKPTMKDILEKRIERTAQVILPKDIALILGYTGISNNSLVVDAGTGTGYTAIFLANYVSNGKIFTYENDGRFLRVAKKNIALSGLTNIKLRKADVTKVIKEKNADLIILDLQDAYKAINHAYKSLALGGYLVVYSPTIDHLTKVLKAIKKKTFIDIKTVENIVREWQSERTLRPKTMGLMHTGFLTFARKVV